MRASPALGAALVFAVLGSCSDAQEPPPAAGASLFEPAPARQWRLPRALNEISGLVVTADGRLLAHDDERAVIYELDIEEGRVTKRFALGDPVVRGDFEGVAADADGALYLITSRGGLFRFAEAGDGERAAFETFDTGLARTCEIEGLAFDAASDSLIIACKTLYKETMSDRVVFYAWSPQARALRPEPWLSVPVDGLARPLGLRALHPSGVDIDPRSGRIVLVAAREDALLELTPDGERAAARDLGRLHRQAEGVALMPDGSLVVADEAAGGRARLTVYERRRP